MADSNTLRTQRSRAHRKGDHTLCKPDRCEVLASNVQVTAPVESVASSKIDSQKRYKRHRQGDHSICLPGCSADDESGDETGDGHVTSQLGHRGQKLWDDVTATWTPSPLHAANLLEACRLVDRLEKLDRQLKGEDWLRFWSRTDDGSVIEVFVDKVLSEAREHATSLRMITADLIKAAGAVKPAAKGGRLASVTALAAVARPPSSSSA